MYELLTIEDIIVFILKDDIKAAQKLELLSSVFPLLKKILQLIILQIDFWDKKTIENIFSYLQKPYNELVVKSRK